MWYTNSRCRRTRHSTASFLCSNNQCSFLVHVLFNLTKKKCCLCKFYLGSECFTSSLSELSPFRVRIFPLHTRTHTGPYTQTGIHTNTYRYRQKHIHKQIQVHTQAHTQKGTNIQMLIWTVNNS